MNENAMRSVWILVSIQIVLFSIVACVEDFSDSAGELPVLYSGKVQKSFGWYLRVSRRIQAGMMVGVLTI